MKKKYYENPESELFTVRFEDNFCASPIEGGNPNRPFGAPARTRGIDEDEENY